MIKTTRPKFNRKNETVKVSMDGSTKELIEEYAAVTQCIARVFVNSCVPGKLDEFKRELYKEMITFTDEAFAEAEKANRSRPFIRFKNILSININPGTS